MKIWSILESVSLIFPPIQYKLSSIIVSNGTIFATLLKANTIIGTRRIASGGGRRASGAAVPGIRVQEAASNIVNEEN
jgi:hypothetical protein